MFGVRHNNDFARAAQPLPTTTLPNIHELKVVDWETIVNFKKVEQKVKIAQRKKDKKPKKKRRDALPEEEAPKSDDESNNNP